MLQKTFTKTLGETISDRLANASLENPVAFLPPNKTILQRISESDKSAAGECLETYGDFVWSIARKYTLSIEENENAVQEIFLDIWQNAGFFDSKRIDEKSFIAQIALKRLLRLRTREK